MKRSLYLLAVAPCLSTVGCTTVGPDYRAPEMVVPKHFSAGPAGPPQLDTWWRSFDDPMFADLIARALAGNLDIAIAGARIREARAREAIAGAAALPEVGAQGLATYNRISENAVALGDLGGAGESGSPPGIGFPGADFETYRVGFDASWELDLFGGTRRAVEAARARTGAMIWDRRDVALSVAGEVASAYLDLRTLQQRLASAEAERERQRRSERIVRARTDGGLVSGIDLRAQQAELARSEAVIPDLRARVRAQIHALCVLTGADPEALSPMLATAAAMPSAPPSIPAGLPSDLLRRRPDIREAERQLAAATADIGVAVADLYPHISLTATPELVSESLTSLIEWGSRNLTAGVGIGWPLFAGGRLRGNIGVATARQEQALLAYRATVLRALKDVEDSLTRQAEHGRQLERLEQSLGSARDAEGLARVRYEGGLISLADVLSAEARRIALEEQVIETRGTRARDVVALYKALGGGWSEAPSDAVPDRRSATAGARP